MLGAAVPPAVVKDRFGDPAGRDRHLFTLTNIGDLALAQRLLDGRLHFSTGAPEKALPVA